MQLNTVITTLVTFTAISTAAPSPLRLHAATNNTIPQLTNPRASNPNHVTTIPTDLHKRANLCSQPSFEDRGSEVSPLISDCMQMHDNFVRTGEWTYSSSELHRTIGSYGSCRFGIESISARGRLTQIGTEDVRTLIRESVSRFGRHDGRVGARGLLRCHGDVELQWGIF
ncbi:putative necrosis-inducing factor-domain-containing protein [Triangularia verruculosa]|uniref:Necrosis-inducing factor-domain-containing protein n=1 Tax=Triangularia verruculosa TaxID=2587418 RepID=A0AAN7AWE5_9PEZI|nr:putative necrosis-inducing factor-domain-containing protein [Triangularia verruculosa]